MSELIENICTTLKMIFPNTPTVTEPFDDGSFIFPSFLVNQINVVATRKLNHEQMRTYSFDIAYFVDIDEDNRATLNAAGDKLMGWFEAVLDDNSNLYAHIISPSWSIVDKVGHFTFSVIQRMQEDNPEQSFNSGNLNYTGGIKN